jgi:hypothetical protein
MIRPSLVARMRTGDRAGAFVGESISMLTASKAGTNRHGDSRCAAAGFLPITMKASPCPGRIARRRRGGFGMMIAEAMGLAHQTREFR